MNDARLSIGSTLASFNADIEKTDASNQNTFSIMHGKEFMTRTVGYSHHNVKGSSSETIYDLIGMDLFYADKKVHHVGERVEFPDIKEKLILPRFIVINNQMPLYEPENPIWGDKKDDGCGYSFIFYLELSKKSRDMLRTIKYSNLPSSFLLLEKFINANKPASPMTERLKLITRIHNLDEVSLNAASKTLVHNFNGKPFLIRTTSTFYKGDNYYEIDIDVHRFGFPARVGLNGVKSVMPNCIFEYGYVIEGRIDTELPEQIFCCSRVYYLQIEKAVPMVDRIPVHEIVL